MSAMHRAYLGGMTTKHTDYYHALCETCVGGSPHTLVREKAEAALAAHLADPAAHPIGAAPMHDAYLCHTATSQSEDWFVFCETCLQTSDGYPREAEADAAVAAHIADPVTNPVELRGN